MDNSERLECGGCNGEGVVRYAVGDVEHVATHASLAAQFDVDAMLAADAEAPGRWEPTDADMDRMEREFAGLFADNDNARVA